MKHRDIFGREIDFDFFSSEELQILEKNGYRPRRTKYEVNRERGRDPKDFGTNCIGDDKRVRVPSCHYTDDRFKIPQTVFGRDVEGKKGYFYNYEDRFLDWNYDLWRESEDVAREYLHRPECDWADRSVMWWEMVLGHFHQRITFVASEDMSTAKLKVNVCIGHILTGHNWSNGHSYYVFGYKLMGKDKDKIPR